ncbi:MAG: hypothetical protein QXH30_02505, partial [Candidatus Bilamarchaeaceae archaeon]
MKKPSITISRGFRGMLSRKTIASLPPLLSSRAISLLSTAYPERAFSSSTKLSAIYQLWLSQKKSEGKLLREAAKMMADLQRLHYFEVQRGLGKPARKGASRRKPPIHRIPLQAMHYSGQLREKLARLGITDQSTISRLEKTIGAEELELRVDGALDTFSGRELVGKQIFSRRPEILIQ